MKKLIDYRKWYASTAKSTSVLRYAFFIGGSKRGLAFSLARRRNVIVVVIDCDEELKQFKLRYQQAGILAFSVGNRESLQTLCESGCPEVQMAEAGVATMLAREGAGASPAAAELACKRLVDSNEFQYFLRSCIASGVQATNGRINCYDLSFYASYCGGQGTGGVSVVAQAVMQELSTLEIPVKVTFDLLGPITYTGLSPLSGQNAVGGLGRVVKFAIDKTNPALKRMSVRVNLHELPPHGQNRAARDLLLRIDEQALNSSSLQEHLIQIAPNQATTGPLGNIVSREMEIFSLIDEQSEIIPTVARLLSVTLTEQLEDVFADPSLIIEKHWELSQRPLSRRTISDLVDNLEEFSCEKFLMAVSRPGAEFSYQVLLDLGKAGEFDLAKLDEYYSETPRTCTQAMQRLTHLQTFRNYIAGEEFRVESELSAAQREVRGLYQKIKRLYERIRRRGFRASDVRLRHNLEILALFLRDLQDSVGKLCERRRTLQLNRRRVQTEEEYLHGRLKDVLKMLEKYVPRGRESFTGTFVIPLDLDDAFESLLRLSLEDDQEQMSGLTRMAPVVSLAGLAHIANSSVVKVEDIARQIVFGEPILRCPPHGAVIRSDRLMKAYCLPPTDAAFSEELRETIRKLDPDSVVVFNDSTEGNFTVCRYEFRSFSHTDQLITGLLKHELVNMRNSRFGSLRNPSGKYEMPQIPPPAAEPPTPSDSETETPPEVQGY